VNVVVPEPIAPEATNLSPPCHSTRIVLPFDDDSIPQEQRFRPLVPASQAVCDIEKALLALNLRTVLFLKNIELIRWKMANHGTSGEVSLEVVPNSGSSLARRVVLRKQEAQEAWLIFQKQTLVKDDQEYQAVVEVAFLLENGSVTKALGTELVVFFPTAKETKLGFLINGPFKTTKARDNISQCEANQFLIDVAAQLASESLEELAKRGLLNPASFDALPLNESDFRKDSFFRALRYTGWVKAEGILRLRSPAIQ